MLTLRSTNPSSRARNLLQYLLLVTLPLPLPLHITKHRKDRDTNPLLKKDNHHPNAMSNLPMTDQPLIPPLSLPLSPKNPFLHRPSHHNNVYRLLSPPLLHNTSHLSLASRASRTHNPHNIHNALERLNGHKVYTRELNRHKVLLLLNGLKVLLLLNGHPVHNRKPDAREVPLLPNDHPARTIHQGLAPPKQPLQTQLSPLPPPLPKLLPIRLVTNHPKRQVPPMEDTMRTCARCTVMLLSSAEPCLLLLASGLQYPF